jgi:hypothetical protein
MVLRRIQTYIPKFEELHLPPVMTELAMTKRGLIVFVGGLKLPALLLVHDAIRELPGLVGSQCLLGDRRYLTVNLQTGRHASGDE